MKPTAQALSTIALLSLLLAGEARAQLKGHYVAGFAGLQSGTQPPPGVSLFVPLYWYTTNDIRNSTGGSVGSFPRVNVYFTGPGLAWVTKAKLLGGHLGGSAAPLAFIKSRIETDSLNVSGSFAFTDMFVQPIQLGWESRRTDVVVGYGLFIPTGKWELGASDNAGLGMWSHLLQAGTTIHLDDKHQWSYSILASQEFHSKKKGTQIQVGQILTVEGGLGRTFFTFETVGGKSVPARITNVGLVYYGQFKVSNDQTNGVTAQRGDRVFGAGLEASLIAPESGWVFAVRFEPEFGARLRTQGSTFLLTVAYQLKSFASPPAH